MPYTITASFKRALFFFVIFFLTVVKGYSQQFYVATSGGTLERVTITNNSLISEPVGGCGYGNFFSIAISGNKIFYNSPYGTLYSGDITGGNTPVISNCTIVSSAVNGNALTIDKQGTLYFVSGNSLFSLVANSTSPVLLGTMPYSAGGDLVFYKNNLYMAANEGGIVKISIANPANSTMYLPIPGSIFGLTVASINGVDKTYAFVGSTILELDMENKVVKGTIGQLPYLPYDAGSAVEAGAVPSVEIQNIQYTQECDVYNKGHVIITTKPHTSQYTYTLNTGENNHTGIFNDLAPGTYHLMITSNGPETPSERDITVPDYSLSNPAIAITKTNPVCDVKGSIKLSTGTANALYKIKYNGQVFDFDHTFTGLDAGNYHFTILKANGCIADEKDYTLQQDNCPPIVINEVQVQAECNAYGQASVKVITQVHPDTYTYILNNESNTTGVFDFLTPGTYILVVNSSGGDHKEREIIVPDFTLNKPVITYKVKSVVCTLLGEIKFTINGDARGAVKVKNGINIYNIDETIKGLTPGPNHFTILNQQDCILDELDVNVLQDKCEPVVFPNTFTPNGDGINDFFGANQESNPLSFKLVIYNRWGNQVFQSQSIFNRWDGTSKGTSAPFGVYYWIATYQMPDGKSNHQKGYVTLIR